MDQTAISVFQQQYFDNFRQALEGIAATRNNEAIPYDAALEVALGWLLDLQARKGRIFVIGNGGSAGVASHLAVDFWKNGKISAMAFNDGSLLTCLANDLAFEDVFAASIRQFGQQGDLAICISSSGNSENIVRGALAAREIGATVITCSGFDPGNRLRTLGDLNFYVPSHSYGIVETLHQLIIHSLLDVKLHLKDGMDVFYKNRV